jgi:hypothetical protein
MVWVGTNLIHTAWRSEPTHCTMISVFMVILVVSYCVTISFLARKRLVLCQCEIFFSCPCSLQMSSLMSNLSKHSKILIASALALSSYGLQPSPAQPDVTTSPAAFPRRYSPPNRDLTCERLKTEQNRAKKKTSNRDSYCQATKRRTSNIAIWSQS